jgi:hypothetical protein
MSGFKRRSATRLHMDTAIRGLKPTATIMQSRRDTVGDRKFKIKCLSLCHGVHAS